VLCLVGGWGGGGGGSTSQFGATEVGPRTRVGIPGGGVHEQKPRESRLRCLAAACTFARCVSVCERGGRGCRVVLVVLVSHALASLSSRPTDSSSLSLGSGHIAH